MALGLVSALFCSAAGYQTASPPAGLLSKLRAFVTASDTALTSAAPGTARTARRTITAPRKLANFKLNPRQQILVQRARSLSKALAALRVVNMSADGAQLAIANGAEPLAARSLIRRASDRFMIEITEITKDAVTTLACDAASRFLDDEELDLADVSLFFSRAAVVDQVVTSAWARLRRLWIPEEINTVLSWQAWAGGIQAEADRFPPSLGYIPGWQTRAYYYYMRLCHAPPF